LVSVYVETAAESSAAGSSDGGFMCSGIYRSCGRAVSRD
jgi:hypothetical protein